MFHIQSLYWWYTRIFFDLDDYYLDAPSIPGVRTSMLMLYIMLGWTSIVAVYGPMSEAVP